MAAAAELPVLGTGISFHVEWRWDVVRHRERVDVLEVISENVVGARSRRELRALGAVAPILLHGLGLSLGSADGLDLKRLEHLARLVDALHPPWISEHIAFMRAGGLDVGHLTPLPFSREAVETVAANVATLRRCIPGVPLLLENIAYTLRLPGREMSEAEFIRAVVETADCVLLLDLENVHANATNHGSDAIEFLAALPLERVAEIHLAGGVWTDGQYADTHTRPVSEESWALLSWLAPRVNIRAVIIERDDDLPPFADLLAEVDRARAILDHAADRSAADAGL